MNLQKYSSLLYASRGTGRESGTKCLVGSCLRGNMIVLLLKDREIGRDVFSRDDGNDLEDIS